LIGLDPGIARHASAAGSGLKPFMHDDLARLCVAGLKPDSAMARDNLALSWQCMGCTVAQARLRRP
jgi:hypothetical protein